MFIKELQKHKKVIYNGQVYYHVTKNFIRKYMSKFENVYNYSMIKLGNRKDYMNDLYVNFKEV